MTSLAKKNLYTLLAFFCGAPLLQAQQAQDSIVYLPLESVYKRSYDAVYVPGLKSAIDGRLDEIFWHEQGVWSELFVQAEPYERSLPQQATRMKLLYDEHNIYIGVICKELDPATINQIGRASCRERV